ncbi:Chitinase [Ascochyta lentis]
MRVLESSNATILPNETESTNSTLKTRELVSPAYVLEPLTGRKIFGVSDLSPGFLDFASLPEMEGMAKRQSAKRQCDASTPCPDGSCCNKSGRCGFGKENCADGCQSNCDAKAFCGKDSEGGNSKCPLNVCCSFFGYCGVESEFCLGNGPTQPCQAGMGSCEVKAAPTCGGATSTGRSIGYYQGGNVRDRQCNRISPKDINTKGLTHLNFAFATIDPNTFEVLPANSADPDLYKEFTGLKSSTLQTWIAIGGWDFNDPGPTRTTFSNLARTAARRARFITSLKAFLTKNGFQGVDIDWEYPGAPDRGGIKEDTDNYVALVKEMRASFGTQFGISMAIPSAYWYMRWFKLKEMEPYVDWFGVMSYDLHGPWDAQVLQIGKVVLGHTNVPEIANWTLPLAYEGVNPAKLNLGLAYYARGYTVADQNCNGVGCAWSGTSRPGPCTNFGGVMSLQEIENQIIPQLGVKPNLLEQDMMMELKWGNQWIGYDNMETIAMKKQWANQHCFGGTMVWSVDFYSGSGSGDIPDGGGSDNPESPGGGQNGGGGSVVYIDPSIYNKPDPVVNCIAPCTLILPPLQLSTKTTISFPPYVTSLDVAWSESTGWTSIVQTTTLTIPPVTTTEIEVWAVTITDTRTGTGVDVWSTFSITPSIKPPPFTITNNPNPLTTPGVSHPLVTRTITPPPYPYSYTPPSNSKPTTTTKSSTDPIAAIIFPRPTWKPGKPGPICKSKCGKPCLIFCNHPCLLDCTDGGIDFPDPKNPNPPKKPTSNPKPDPKPSGKPAPPPPRPSDPKGDDPQDEEQEEDDQACALEMGLPLPTYRPTTSTTSVAPKPTAPAPSPSPPPDPPKPNRDTENKKCYDSGALVTRGMMIDAIEAFCDFHEGTVLDASRPDTQRTLSNGDGYGAHCMGELGCFVHIYISVTAINGCKWKMEGSGANQECGRILRRAVDECDQSSTEHKQGGTVDSNCAQWKIDPDAYW